MENFQLLFLFIPMLSLGGFMPDCSHSAWLQCVCVCSFHATALQHSQQTSPAHKPNHQSRTVGSLSPRKVCDMRRQPLSQWLHMLYSCLSHEDWFYFCKILNGHFVLIQFPELFFHSLFHGEANLEGREPSLVSQANSGRIRNSTNASLK